MGRTKNVAVAPIVSAGKKIWLTNTVYTVGAGVTPDSLCQASRPAGVTTGVALLAYTSRAASAVLDLTMNYVRPDGTLVGTGAQLASTQGDASTSPLPVLSGVWQCGDGMYREFGLPFTWAWTGQATLTSPGTTVTTCGDWADTTQQAGVTGIFGSTQTKWWSGGTWPCVVAFPLYCVQSAP